ncbi:concanavalin A-like lectin/glucanase domain-containing protein [Xylariales sp. PMI_506]|nr:concanavalin A-like lectin/glucanase domain-containing protein [Xylariales sp. PMI_506]
MVRSLATAIAGTALLARSAAASEITYEKHISFTSENFFNKFQFMVSYKSWNDTWDPTGGYVDYVTPEKVAALELVNTDNDKIYLGVDYTNVVADSATGRASVRLESIDKYSQGLYIFSLSHLPEPVDGAWPAIWTYGAEWPNGGDIDLYENWNNVTFNRQTLHVGGTCTINSNDVTMTGEWEQLNCNADETSDQGCSADDTLPGAYGSSDGGVYAFQWTNDYIKMWHWDSCPEDIFDKQPDLSTWPEPTYSTEGNTNKCDLESLYTDQTIVFNIDFCGVSGLDAFWNSTSTFKKTGLSCVDYVKNYPADFENVFFEIDFVDVYYPVASSGSSSSSVVASSTTAPSSSGFSNGSYPLTSSSAVQMTTSTVSVTSVYTITSCAPEITDCPARLNQVTTEVIDVYTTVCPVTATATEASITWPAMKGEASETPVATGSPIPYKTTVAGSGYSNVTATAYKSTGAVGTTGLSYATSTPAATGAAGAISTSVFGVVAAFGAAVAAMML